MAQKERQKVQGRDQDIKEVPENIAAGKIKANDVPRKDQMFSLDGAWMPNVDPALIGAKNFQTLRNLRYSDSGIEGINGYTKVNTTALVTYTYIKNGIHFRTNRTADSYVLARAENSGGTGRIYANTTAIGSQGDFASSVGTRASGAWPGYLHEDASTNLVGRFDLGPNGTVAYANGEEGLIWGGEEAIPGAVFTTEDSSETNPVDVTEKLTNSRNDADNRVTIDTADRDYLVILTTRPVQGIKFYMQSYNGTASTLTVTYWNGTGWGTPSNTSDGTSSGGAALAQDGTYIFDYVGTDTAKPKHFEERYLYAYRVFLSDGSAVISEISLNAPMQAPTNVWDGLYRQPIQCQFYNQSDDAYEDYTLHVAESSTLNTPVGAILDGMTSSDKLMLMFEEQQAAIKFTMLANLINATASRTMTLKYWNGSSWTALSITDETEAVADKTFSQSGLVYWDPPSDEEKTTLFNTIGYAYEITVSGTLTGTEGGDEEVLIDLVDGIPAQKDIETYEFPVLFKNKTMFCAATENNEGNRIDYCADNAPDVWNGDDSSMDGFQSLYVGSIEKITAARQLYNRFGSNIYTMLLILKNSETHLLTGDGPLDYKLYPISLNTGCPAPLTLTTAELGQNVGEAVSRNVAIWCSHAGPVMFDGATIVEVKGLDKYFDPNENESVNFDQLPYFQGWFDSAYYEYNLLMATGSNTSLNLWVCYDLVRKKWFQKDVGGAQAVQTAWPVIATNGDQYLYGGLETGLLIKLEDGTTFDGTPITNKFRTGDFFPSGNEWDITLLRRIKFVAKRITESGANVSMYHYADTDSSGGIALNFVNVDDERDYNDSPVDGTELITNGDMELDANWSSVGTPSTQERSSTQANNGTYSRKFTVDGASEGIKSDAFTTTGGTTYGVNLAVYPDDTTTVTVKMRAGDDSGYTKTKNFTGLTQDAWNGLHFIYTEAAGTGGASAYIEITGGSETSGTWYVDDVYVMSEPDAITDGFSWNDVDASDSYQGGGTGLAGVSWGDAPTSVLDLTIDVGTKRLIRSTQTLNKEAWSHSLEFEFTSSSTAKGLQPIMWGYTWGFRRKDYEA